MLSHLGLEHAVLIPIAELERADPELPAVKSGRLPVEYYWTCGPAFLCHVFERNAQVQMLTYLDADLFFFSDPTPIYDELGAGSILIVESRRAPSYPDLVPHLGRYNVGMIVFRSTASGLSCLRRWRQQCLEWCFDLFEQNRFGDQAYLNEWPERFDGVRILQHPGGGVGPANVLGRAGRLPGWTRADQGCAAGVPPLQRPATHQPVGLRNASLAIRSAPGARTRTATTSTVPMCARFRLPRRRSARRAGPCVRPRWVVLRRQRGRSVGETPIGIGGRRISAGSASSLWREVSCYRLSRVSSHHIHLLRRGSDVVVSGERDFRVRHDAAP